MPSGFQFHHFYSADSVLQNGCFQFDWLLYQTTRLSTALGIAATSAGSNVLLDHCFGRSTGDSVVATCREKVTGRCIRIFRAILSSLNGFQILSSLRLQNEVKPKKRIHLSSR